MPCPTGRPCTLLGAWPNRALLCGDPTRTVPEQGRTHPLLGPWKQWEVVGSVVCRAGWWLRAAGAGAAEQVAGGPRSPQPWMLPGCRLSVLTASSYEAPSLMPSPGGNKCLP